MDLYRRIEELCRKKDINVTELCRAAGVSRSSLSELKGGRIQSLTPQSLQKIAEYFGTSVDYLLTGQVTQTLGAALPSAVKQQMMELVYEAPEERVQAAYAILKAYLEQP